jgi:TraX protein
MASNAPALISRRFPADFAQADLECAKWAAIVTMAIDHYGKIVDQSVFVPTHAIGRMSFPLFAAIIAVRLATRADLYARYFRCLIPWAVVSQPVFVLVGRSWYDGNILFTLSLGVGAAWLLNPRTEMSDLARGLALAAICVTSFFVDYGPLGVAVIPAMIYMVRRHGYAGAAAVGPLGLAANIDFLSSPVLTLPDFAALLATPVLMFSLWAKNRLPRLPTQAFYAFYPAHLLALHFYDLYA